MEICVAGMGERLKEALAQAELLGPIEQPFASLLGRHLGDVDAFLVSVPLPAAGHHMRSGGDPFTTSAKASVLVTNLPQLPGDCGNGVECRRITPRRTRTAHNRPHWSFACVLCGVI